MIGRKRSTSTRQQNPTHLGPQGTRSLGLCCKCNTAGATLGHTPNSWALHASIALCTHFFTLISDTTHIRHEDMLTSNVFYGKFSDTRMATLVVKHDNFLFGWQVSVFFGFVFSFSAGNFSSKKCQNRSTSCHTCGTYHLGKRI